MSGPAATTPDVTISELYIEKCRPAPGDDFEWKNAML
jgi:hypothetical protein